MLLRTTSSNPDFLPLIIELDKDLAIRDGDEAPFFAQLNKTGFIPQVVIAYKEGKAVGCGAIRPYDEKTMEVKRMYVLPEFRGQGIASLVLQELENWCRELKAERCILETGKKQPEAISLYRKNKYTLIPNFGPYANVESSVCLEKVLNG
jgi:GNAT superfamily N-acetyltransferase